MTVTRVKLLLIVAGAALGALLLLSWTQSWFSLVLDGGQRLDVPGQSAAPALSALGLACLALAGALAIAGRVLRIVLGVIETRGADAESRLLFQMRGDGLAQEQFAIRLLLLRLLLVPHEDADVGGRTGGGNRHEKNID